MAIVVWSFITRATTSELKFEVHFALDKGCDCTVVKCDSKFFYKNIVWIYCY
jgi:hypothetical protein